MSESLSDFLSLPEDLEFFYPQATFDLFGHLHVFLLCCDVVT